MDPTPLVVAGHGTVDHSLERAVIRTVAARTYGAVATGGCHDTFELEWFVTQAVQTLSPAGQKHAFKNSTFSHGPF